jgi:CBS domain-containing protein
MNQKPSKVWVENVMTAEVHSCSPDDSIGDALDLMRRHRVRRLPVVDGDGHLKGLLSFDDVVLKARSADSEEFAGPYYDDIAKTLKAVNRHQLPGPSMA